MASGMEEMLDSPMVMVQYGLALAIPAVLTAIMNVGCGKKRDQPLRPGEKKTLSKSAKPAGVASSKSKRASKSSSASAKSGKSAKKDKSGKSKKSVPKDKSGKSSKSSKRSAKKDKSSKSSKSKKSKRELKSKTAAVVAADAGKAPASQRSDKQPSSAAGRTSAETAEKRAAKAQQTAVALANDNSAKSAPTQVASASLKQPSSGGAYDGNANVAVATGAGGTTALVAIAGDSTRDLIKMEPAELRWSSAGGMQKISLINQSAERQAIKVKCSDNNVYRVNPVYAIVEPGQTLNVDVMRQNGSGKVDKIVFVTTKAGIEENPKNAFKAGAPASMMVLPLLATSAAAAHNQPALAV